MTTTATTDRNFRAFGRCRRGHTVNVDWSEVRGGWITCNCGSAAMARSLEVKHNDRIICAEKCMGATGPACSCNCGGRNHGGAHFA